MSEQLALSPQQTSPRRSAVGITKDLARRGHTWLAHLVTEVVEEYDKHACGSERSLQDGMAWRRLTVDFADMGRQLGLPTAGTSPPEQSGFAPPDDSMPPDFDLLRILTALYRLGRCDDPFGRVLLRTFAPLSIEQNCNGESPQLGLPDSTATPAQAISLVLRTLKRWCDWIEADLHFYAHSRCHQLPASAPPGVEVASWHLPPSDDLLKVAKAHFGPQSQICEPKERLPGVILQAPGPWLYQEIDTLIISLWPLLKRHNWSYKELLTVLRLLATSPNAYPCSHELDLAGYCSSVLGLRCSPEIKPIAGSYAVGLKVALRLFPKS